MSEGFTCAQPEPIRSSGRVLKATYSPFFNTACLMVKDLNNCGLRITLTHKQLKQFIDDLNYLQNNFK